ncbi:MAG: hypothetical protein JNG90_13780 [Planctomycetaceae bacterium]|nr:hypothetical protein [Planctomycetaceae bacterium]
MAMQKREKVLAGVVGLLVLGFAGNWLFQQALQGPLNARYERITKLKNDIARKEKELRLAQQAGKKLTAWQRQSLPRDPEVARSLYQEWLLDEVSRAGFKLPNVDSGQATAKKGAYQRIAFSVRGQATLEQLTRFLYDFYRANHLHQIQRLSINPVANSPELDLSLSIEALILPDSDRKDRLSTERSTRLASEALSDYRVLVERNFFGQGAGDYDAADFAQLTAITDVDGAPQAWFKLQTSGETLRLSEGQSFEIGQFRGTVAEIRPPDLIVASDDQRWLLTLGENLSQATALPADF